MQNKLYTIFVVYILFLTFNPFPNKLWCLRVCSRSIFENTVGKGEIARIEQFLLFPQCFLLVWKTICDFHQIRNCRLQTVSIWKSLKFVAWERVKQSSKVWVESFLQLTGCSKIKNKQKTNKIQCHSCRTLFLKQFLMNLLHLLLLCWSHAKRSPDFIIRMWN